MSVRVLRSKFLFKLYAGYAAVILVTAAIVGVLVEGFVERQTLEAVDRQLEAEALLVRGIVHDLDAAGVEAWDAGVAGHPALQERIAAIHREIGTRLTVIRADGVVLADSHENPVHMDNHGQRPEVLTATAEAPGTSIRFSRNVSRRMRYLAIPLESAATPGGAAPAIRGWMRASLPLDKLDQRVAKLRRLILFGMTLAAFVGLLLGLLLARRVTRRIEAMAAAADAIARGAYEERVPVTSGDELGQLAVALNTMSEALRRSMATISADRTKLAAILSSMLEGVVAIDRDERVVHMNQVAGRLLGVVPEEASSRPISEVLTETLRHEDIQRRMVRLPGLADRFLDLRASPLRAEDELAGAVLVMGDVTQLRRLETMRRDFVANVSHELKTPVAAIRGLVETLIDDPEIDPGLRRRFFGKIVRQSERLSDLLTDLLSLSRLESEEQPLRLIPLDVREVLDELVKAYQPASEARRVRIEKEWGSEPLIVRGEEEALRQAVGNLLSNAIKFSPEGGRVVLRARQEAARVTIEVQDEGPGIEPRHHARLFERFYRVDAARSRELGGTGLGLAIVKHTALALGGEVGLESVPGEGSTFLFCLPLSEDLER